MGARRKQGKVRGSDPIWRRGLARLLGCTSVGPRTPPGRHQAATRLPGALPGSPGTLWPWGRGGGSCRNLAHRVILGSPRRCKMVPLPRGAVRPWVHSPCAPGTKLLLPPPRKILSQTRFHPKPEETRGPHVTHPHTLNPS